MNRSMRMTRYSPLAMLAAIAMSWGCDSVDETEQIALDELVDALDRSPTQELAQTGEEDLLAFDAVSDTDAKGGSQALTGGCTLLRPAAWHQNGATCVEYYKKAGSPPDTLAMSDGQSFISYSHYLGSGSALISCNSGSISIETISCRNGPIFEP